jgi:hypothetical protein
MTKIIPYKKLISIVLVLVLVSPSFLKGAHFLFVHHEHHHISFSDRPEIEIGHTNCPICAFDFVEFIDNKHSRDTGTPEFFSHVFTLHSQSAWVLLASYSFNLRAPPVSL